MNEEQGRTKRSYQEAAHYLLHLMAAALNQQTPEEKPDTCTWEQIWEFAAFNNVEAIAWPAVKMLQASSFPEIYKKWEQAATAVLLRQLQFDVEREQILEKLSKQKISWLPLKGILIKEYYPMPGMRYMCDNDILYGITQSSPDGGYQIAGNNEEEKERSIKTAQQKLVEIMREQGYEDESLQGNHDVFMKKPIFNFEMHRDLVSTDNPMYFYYKNPWKRAVLNEEGGYGYHFSDEDEYLFLLIHAHKHYSGGGCGVRTLADEYVFLKKKGDRLDKEYLQTQLEELQLTDFEQKLKKAAFHAFTPGECVSEEDDQIIGYMVSSGTYGHFKNQVDNAIKRQAEQTGGDIQAAKKRYLKDRIFASEEKMKNYYPFFYKHRSLRIFLPAYRLIKGMIIHPKQLFNEMKFIKKKK